MAAPCLHTLSINPLSLFDWESLPKHIDGDLLSSRILVWLQILFHRHPSMGRHELVEVLVVVDVVVEVVVELVVEVLEVVEVEEVDIVEVE